MKDIQLYINDTLTDLSDDSPIALTFQINNLAEVRNQQGNTSNQFKLPLTQRNRQILGFPDDVAFCTGLPYAQYPAKLIQDGLEIIPYGIVELNGIDQDTASITILSGNVDFFDAIDGKLYDMGDSTSPWGKGLLWKPYDHEWTLENVAHSQTKTEGWIYPIVDYGNFTEDHSAAIDVNFMRPGFFIKTAIELLVKSAGYKATGSLLADPLYPLLIAQFSNGSWEHGTEYQTQPDLLSSSAANGSVIQLNHPNDRNPGGRFIFDNILADPSSQLSGGIFTATHRSDFTITVNFPNVRLRGKITGSHPTYLHVTITIHTPGQPDIYPSELDLNWDLGDWVRDEDTSGGSITGYVDIFKQTLSCETELAAGQSVEVNYTWFGDNPSYLTVDTGATFTVKAQNNIVRYSQTIQCERIFPDITQKDLLKDTLQRFGIICQADNANKTISFNSFRDIVNNIAIAKNWTEKCLDQGKAINFQLGGYAQSNTLKYKEDDAVLPAGFADSVIKVADTTLPASTDLIESQFAPTLNRPFFGGTIAQIKMIDDQSDSNDLSITVSPRILINKTFDLRTVGKSVKFSEGNAHDIIVNDIISTPYFYKPDGDFSLCFGDMPGISAGKPLPGLRTKYYPELEKILRQTKKVVRYFLLTPRDILELDLLIPVYLEQDSAYYYINKIDAWRKGQPVKVELVKLG